ncbi:hypothetical protein PGT21_009300 [Puccinia graminis f. sp. tritici]|uniref:HSF-type DNA-binding domain-containing protein n=1 Tax=Puccinia graminis f. sp. tritici TaxID=56615 RepID=A0A5B0R0R0_PUCGR|nr:hypothetical protein PGT21_009300 [Puccinia graminis f. sp. tritici]KAA1137068.1 hypothetical protein PGTUg99_004371 [Puccinia graminis f. sp. tritici]
MSQPNEQLRFNTNNSFSTRNKASLSISTQQQQQQQQNHHHSTSSPSTPPSPSSPSSNSSRYQPAHSNPIDHNPFSASQPTLNHPTQPSSSHEQPHPITQSTSPSAPEHPHHQHQTLISFQSSSSTLINNHSSSSDHNQASSSSVGPNVAGRIGVGGNVMVDPYNPTSLSHKGGVGAGAFVYKVYNMLLDPSFQHLISFNPNGQSFTVSNVQDFSKTVLPKHFKHNNFSSFVRQLNMYGFHKVNKTPRGQRGNDNSAAWEFVHPKFHRGRPDLLEQIRRKTLDSESGSQSSRTKDPALTNQSQPSPTTQRFPLDHLSFLPTLTRPHPSFQLVHASSSPFFSHLHQRTKSDCQSELSPAAPGATFNVPDILNTPLPSNALFETGPNPTIGPNTDHSLNEHQSSRQYNHSFSHSPYPVDPPSSSHSQISSAPITPLSAVPPPSSPMDMSLDPKTFANDPLETLTELKTQLSGRFQGINASYEALYQELHETRRRQGVLIDLVEKMHKTLQNTPNTNVGYEFPSRELLWGSAAETTPVFKITEHDYPGHHPMIYEDINSQQQSSVSVGTSPSVSEFSHTAQTSPCDSAYRSLSVGPGGFGGFRNLTLASYPNSPVGGLMNDHQQQAAGSNRTAPSSPPSTIIMPSRSVSVQQQGQQGGSGLLDEATNRFLIPSISPSHHAQQALGGSNNGLNSVPVSPRDALSTALKTPLPPSPSPFKQIGCSGTAGPGEMISKQQTDEYRHAFDSFIHNHHHQHHPTLSIIAPDPLDDRVGSFTAPPTIDQSHISIKSEECGTASKPGTATGGPGSFDGLIPGPTSDSLIFASDTPPPSALVHTHHSHPHHRQTPSHGHHLLQPSDENSIAVCLASTPDSSTSTSNHHHQNHHHLLQDSRVIIPSLNNPPSDPSSPSVVPNSFKGKKRPASGSMDLSNPAIHHPNHLNHLHHLNHHAHSHSHSHSHHLNLRN